MIKAQIPLEFSFGMVLESICFLISPKMSLFQSDIQRRKPFLEPNNRLIYSQSGVLYEIFPNTLQSSIDPQIPKPGPHVDGIVGSISNVVVDLVANQMKQMTIHPLVAGQAHASTSPLSKCLMYMLCR
jgi:hypothetical protein